MNNNNNNNNMNNEEETSSSGNNNDRKRKFESINNNNNNNNSHNGSVVVVEEEQHEISRSEMLAKFLTDEQLMDVVLQGSDGMEVPANRCVLSSRSQVFRQMLLGNFKEASEGKIKIGYEGNVLKTIVEYICTDSAELFYLLGCKDDDSSSTGATAPSSIKGPSSLYDNNFKNLIATLISVADAAVYFQLPGLTKKLHKVVCDVGNDQPVVSLMLLDSCHRSGLLNVPSALYRTILKNVRCLPPNDDTFVNNDDKSGIYNFSPDTLGSILQDKYMEWGEFQLYRLVSAWVNGGGGGGGGSTGAAAGGGGGAGAAVNESDEEEYKSRVQIAKTRFVQHIRFENIDARQLFAFVSNAEFVDNSLLFDAYKAQALAATTFHQSFQNVINKPRYQPWSNVTPTNIDDVIAIKIQNSGQPRINGIYQRQGYHFGLAKFVMPITYHGRARELWIMSCVTRTSRHWWFVTLIDEEHPGTDRDIDFYRVLQDPANPQIPPRTGWRVESDAIAPPPELLYKLKEVSV